MRISVIGLGKLGLCTAACFASKGTTVIGLDTNRDVLDALGGKRNPIDETGLDDLLRKAWPSFSVTGDMAEAVNGSDATLIIVPTPSGPDGRFVNDYVVAALEAIGRVLRTKDTFHIVDVVSTVMPGSSDTVFKPLLEKASGKACGKDVGLVYNPEFIALGSVIQNFLNPDMVLIGASDSRSGGAIKDLYASMVDSAPRFAVMSLLNAEITKLSLNCYVTMKISFVNELGALCEHIPGATVDDITAALGADSRIGPKYMKSGLGFGGPCFPRDNIAFQACAKEHGYEACLGPQVVNVNGQVVDRLFRMITVAAAPGAKVALLGLSYKPHTHIIEESQSILLARRLQKAGYAVCLHDPKAIQEARATLGGSVEYETDPYRAAAGASVVALMTSWPDYEKLDIKEITGAAAPEALIVDSWRTYIGRREEFPRYTALGVGAQR
jgi:UDPglucose 6-dehydrogenase